MCTGRSVPRGGSHQWRDKIPLQVGVLLINHPPVLYQYQRPLAQTRRGPGRGEAGGGGGIEAILFPEDYSLDGLTVWYMAYRVPEEGISEARVVGSPVVVL